MTATTRSARPAFASVGVGDKIPAVTYPVKRFDLVRYAGASGDFNLIHWNERFAKLVGLPDVIAHGMFTMATAGRLVTDWAGDPGAVLEYGVRFTSMVPVPDDDAGATNEDNGEVTGRDEAAHTVTVAITATAAGREVLGQATAVVRLP
jgi:acyl dehydratase